MGFYLTWTTELGTHQKRVAWFVTFLLGEKLFSMRVKFMNDLIFKIVYVRWILIFVLYFVSSHAQTNIHAKVQICVKYIFYVRETKKIRAMRLNGVSFIFAYHLKIDPLSSLGGIFFFAKIPFKLEYHSFEMIYLWIFFIQW